jgi:hypothetical protein
MSAKKKAAPKKAAPKKRAWTPIKDAKKNEPKKSDYNDAFIRRAIANGATVSEMTVDEAADRMEESWLRGAFGIPKYPGFDLGASHKPRLRIGSIVRLKEDTVALIVWALSRLDAGLDNRVAYRWRCINLTDPTDSNYLMLSDDMLSGCEIIGHFDFFGLVNGNDKR